MRRSIIVLLEARAGEVLLCVAPRGFAAATRLT
jgi:hypothetical protein